MPNWCNNCLIVRHDDPAMIDRLVEAYEQNRLFQTIKPMDEALLASDAWYDWRVNNWGTKWELDHNGNPHVRKSPNEVGFGFDTAWAPPEGIYAALIEQGYTLTGYYYEPGMGFAGMYFTDPDGQLADDYYDIGEMTADEVADELPSDLDEAFAISEQMRLDEEYESESEAD